MLTGDTINFGGLGDGNVGGVARAAPGSEVGQEYVPDADFPVGHLSGGTSFPTVASRLQVKLLLDPEVPQPMEVLDPLTYLAPLHLLRKICAPGTQNIPRSPLSTKAHWEARIV